MWALAIIELDSLADTCFRFRPGLPSMQVDTLVFQRSPEPFYEDVVEEPSLAIH